ncbi:tigger transposable element-derived protein 6 [Plakobranchus ocellatus]|uniref:Tigger transposable element-derived protein 6 n=1 Tax=Plakobranchus ocellatus TaxID=259542 RepID=A0AAV4DKF7_9GAST|nr:tigger transposable element-derived protein 6 [Plakobranchus ocellatus]
MSAVLISEWPLDWNRDRQIQNQRKAFLPDNYSTHPKQINLSNIEQIFLAPNITSFIQPMDGNTMKDWIGQCKSIFNHETITKLDSNSTLTALEFAKSFKLLDVIYLGKRCVDKDESVNYQEELLKSRVLLICGHSHFSSKGDFSYHVDIGFDLQTIGQLRKYGSK